MRHNAPLRWLFLDLNSYFASVEQHLNPALRRRPVAVAPVMTDSTCAIAASYEAKAFGVKTGTPIWEARKMCPGLIVVPANHKTYVEFHEKIVEEVGRHVPVTNICSIDEMACRLMDNENAPDVALALARRIKRGIARNVGVCLRSSIGIAPNKFLAKVATDMEKPDGLVMLQSADLPGRLHDLTLRDIPGIAGNMERRLARGGVTTLRGFLDLSPKRARSIWGGIEGERMWHQLHGYDLPDRETQRGSVGHSHVLAPELRPLDRARLVARRLTLKAASRLRRAGDHAGMLALSVRFEGLAPGQRGPKFAEALRLEPTQDSFLMLAALERLWGRMVAEYGGNGQGWQAKKVGVTLAELRGGEADMADLFAPPAARPQPRRELARALDKLNEKYGRDAVTVGVVKLDRRAVADSFTGTKIAFTRIPELAEFHE